MFLARLGCESNGEPLEGYTYTWDGEALGVRRPSLRTAYEWILGKAVKFARVRAGGGGVPSHALPCTPLHGHPPCMAIPLPWLPCMLTACDACRPCPARRRLRSAASPATRRSPR